MLQWNKTNDVLGTANRGTPVESGLCSLCRADCAGRCETWLSSLVGRAALYPRDFGLVTAGAGNTCQVGVSYNALRIVGRANGATGRAQGALADADERLFTNVGLATSFGAKGQTRARLPLLTGALGSTLIAARYWDPLAVGCALAGIPIVIGENVVGIDRAAVLEKGAIVSAPELDRRIAVYKRYGDGHGGIIVQLNVEDARNGVARYVIDRFGPEVAIELKWGQGAKNIGGEIKVADIAYARFLKARGYLVDPDPDDPAVAAAFASGAVREFARHSRLGHTAARDAGAVREAFLEDVAHLRGLGFARITLKTGAYGMEGLAMAIRFASEANLDLLTIDGAGGGTGMSPWNMMETWGVPSVLLHAKAREYAALVAATGRKPADMAFAGGFAREDHVFKALALGAPYVKMVCLGRAMMIPAFLGSNIEGVLFPERRETVSGNWDSLPRAVAALGARPEAIFAGWHMLAARLGKEAMGEVPLGAVAVCTLLDKLGAGLQQLLAGARKFDVADIDRDDIVAANRETARETGVAFVTEAGDEAARRILLA
ncbi:MAG: glutamate synthase-related protein [Solidesulfovibrio sp. DCME]|uniref:glutamate synthase-related protein n=1 Tax=Solidesulfovibrio sp. DCME TaxID=3447380 RepID=UPI003D0A825C